MFLNRYINIYNEISIKILCFLNNNQYFFEKKINISEHN